MEEYPLARTKLKKTSPTQKSPPDASRQTGAAYGLGLTSDEMMEQFGIPDSKITKQRLRSLTNLCWFGRNEDPETTKIRMIDAVKRYEALAPRDEIEAILCEQIIGNTLAINECLGRASRAEYLETFLKCGNTATKFEGQLLKQVAALDKRRGRNPQKVVVEHVNVESGGQAIVGHVETKESKS